MLQIYVGSARDLSAKNNQNKNNSCPRLQPYFIGFCRVGVSQSQFFYVVSALQFLYPYFKHERSFNLYSVMYVVQGFKFSSDSELYTWAGKFHMETTHGVLLYGGICNFICIVPFCCRYNFDRSLNFCSGFNFYN